jgi:hypothetical protein
MKSSFKVLVLVALFLLAGRVFAYDGTCSIIVNDINSDLNLSVLTSDQAIVAINAKYDAMIAGIPTSSAEGKWCIAPVLSNYRSIYDKNYIQAEAIAANCQQSEVDGVNRARQLAIQEYTEGSITLDSCDDSTTVVPNNSTSSSLSPAPVAAPTVPVTPTYTGGLVTTPPVFSHPTPTPTPTIKIAPIKSNNTHIQGCTSEGPYNTITGALCAVPTVRQECAIGDLFSYITGVSCSLISSNQN